jgi:hypothetical protein
MLNTHRDTHTTTWMHKISQDLEFRQKGWKWEPLLPRTEREENRGRGGGYSPRGEEHWRGRRRIAAGEGRSPERGEIARQRETTLAGRRDEPVARSRAGGLFF